MLTRRVAACRSASTARALIDDVLTSHATDALPNMAGGSGRHSGRIGILRPGDGGAARQPVHALSARGVYIYHIAQYTEWPKETFPDETAPFVLGILGDDPFHENIDVIKTRRSRTGSW